MDVTYLCSVLAIYRIQEDPRFAAGSSDMTSQSDNCPSARCASVANATGSDNEYSVDLRYRLVRLTSAWFVH